MFHNSRNISQERSFECTRTLRTIYTLSHFIVQDLTGTFNLKKLLVSRRCFSGVRGEVEASAGYSTTCSLLESVTWEPGRVVDN
jgi:hypothetical protein